MGTVTQLSTERQRNRVSIPGRSKVCFSPSHSLCGGKNGRGLPSLVSKLSVCKYTLTACHTNLCCKKTVVIYIISMFSFYPAEDTNHVSIAQINWLKLRTKAVIIVGKNHRGKKVVPR